MADLLSWFAAAENWDCAKVLAPEITPKMLKNADIILTTAAGSVNGHSVCHSFRAHHTTIIFPISPADRDKVVILF